jgi:hypothetical protein
MKVSVGRIVHYVLPCCTDDLRFRSNAMGIHRPAIVIAVRDSGALVLSVFLDEHDARGEQEVMRIPIAHQDEDEKRPGSWHWPERDE